MIDRSSGAVAVVDDDQGVLRSLGDLLASADYAVHSFSSARALLQSGCLPELDCVISDVDIPGLNGFELVRLIHAIRPGVPIIFITGYPDTLKRLPTLGGSQARIFTKPFDGPALLAAVAEVLRAARP